MKCILVNASCVRSSLLNALSSGWRLDLRDLTSYRKTYLRLGSQGSCIARIGSTIISSNVTAEIAEPKNSRPSEGMVNFNLSFFTPVTVSDSSVRSQDYVNEIRSLLRDSVLQSGSIDLESLCIISGEKVWKINVNVTVLNADGNILDCASLAAVASLADFSLPASSVEGRCMRLWCPREKAKVPVIMNHFPLFVTFCLFHDGKTVIVDPSEAEERLAESKLYIAMNVRQEICALKSVSKKQILLDELRRCIVLAEDRVRDTTSILTEKLEYAKSNRKLAQNDTDHITLHEVFDQDFDLPWHRLLDTPKTSKEEPETNVWGMEVEGETDADDANGDASDQNVKEELDNSNNDDGETVTVEHSEFRT